MGLDLGGLMSAAVSTVVGGAQSVLSAPAKVTGAVLDAILPPELKWVGDLIGMGVNIMLGNYAGAMKDAVALVAEMPELFSRIGLDESGLDPAQGEPEPPPTPAGADGTHNPAPMDTGDGAAAGGDSSPPAGTGSPAGGASGVGAAFKTAEAKEFFTLGSDAFMKAVRDGSIPDEILDSEKGMRMLQARMNHFQEMTSLMTNMMRAMHEMQSQIISNVRA
jgi:hypothetical protein